MLRMRACRTASLVVALMVVVGLASPAAADDPLPFRGRAVEVVTSAVPVEGGILVTTTGAGEATHLGRFTREATVLIHPDGTFEGTVVFTAANGDQLGADLEGGPTSLTTQAGTYTFSGGTGRFSDATGEADFTAVTSDGIHVALTFEGAIEF
jgi:hypothetical protein